jgi:hypothetical protein
MRSHFRHLLLAALRFAVGVSYSRISIFQSSRATLGLLKFSFLFSASLVSILLLSPVAQAACGSGVANGSGGTDFTASGAVAGPCTLSDHDTLSVTGSGTLNNGGGNALITSANGVSVTNGGTISGSDTGAFVGGGTINSFINSGTLTGAGGSGMHVNSGLVTTFTNSGTVSGTSSADGFDIDGAATVSTLSNTNSGTISSINGTGLLVTGSLNTFINSGTIFSTNGSAFGNDSGIVGSITNNAGGQITGGSNGIENDLGSSITTLNNAGAISGAAYAIYNGGTISGLTNSGTISTTNDGTYVIFNDGGTVGTLNNSGTISSSGNNTFVVRNDGTINSLSNSGSIFSTSSGAGVFNGPSGTITNLTNSSTGLIATQSYYAIENDPGGNIGTITNNGTISATSGIAINNHGSIGSLINTGTISATTGNAIYLTQNIATFNNTNGVITSASVSPSTGTIDIEGDLGVQTITGGTISNTGTANTAVAINIGAAQTSGGDNLNFQNVHLIADGDTAGSGHGIALENGTNAANVNFLNNSVVRGNIVSGGNLHTVLNGTAVTGNLTLAGTNNSLTIAGNTTINGTTAFGTGVNTAYIAAYFTTQGAFTTAVGGQTNFTIFGGSFTADNAVGFGSGAITVNNGALLNLATADVTTTGAFTNHGTTSIGVGRTISVGSLNTVPTDGILSYTASSTGNVLNTGHINTGATAANLSNQTVNVNFIGGGTLTGTARSLIASGTGNATVPVAGVIDNSYLYNFGIVAGTPDPNHLYLQVTQATTPADASDDSNNANAAEVLLGPSINNSDPVTNQIQTNLNNAPTRQAFNNVVSSTLPTVNNDNAAAASSFISDVFDIADS